MKSREKPQVERRFRFFWPRTECRSRVRLAKLVPRSAYTATPPGTAPPPLSRPTHHKMDRSGSSDFAGAAATTGRSNPAPWSDDKESPNNEDDSNEDDGDHTTPAKVTDPLAPKLANNEVSYLDLTISI